MPGTLVGYMQADTSRARSAGLWNGCPSPEELHFGPRRGLFFEDDFDTEYSTDLNRYDVLEADAGSSIALTGQAVDLDGGVLRFTTGATDENEVYLGGGISVGILSKLEAATCDLWLECCCKLSAVSAETSFAVGLGEPGIVAANMITDATGALVDKDYVGFRILSNDSDGLDAVYNTASGGGETIHKEAGTTGSQVLTAATWFKPGLRYSARDKKLYWYVNGVRVDMAGVSEAATNFPDGANGLHFFIGAKTVTATGFTFDLDWVQWAVLFTDNLT